MIPNVDLSGEENKIRAALLQPREIMLRELTSIFFESPAFPEYASRYFSAPLRVKYIESDILSAANRLPEQDKVLVSAGRHLSGRYTHFASSADSREQGVRQEEEYPLQEQDMAQARQYLAENPELHYGVMVIKDMLCEYLADCSGYFEMGGRIQEDLKKSLSSPLGDMLAAAYGFTLPHDLSPQLAKSFADAGKSFEELDQGDFRKALVDIFRNQAMKSENREHRVTVCPFSSLLAKVFSLNPVRQDNGALLVENGNFGDLLKFVRVKIQAEVPRERLSMMKEDLGLG